MVGEPTLISALKTAARVNHPQQMNKRGCGGGGGVRGAGGPPQTKTKPTI